MTKIELIGAPFSSYFWVVRMACEEKSAPYVIVPAGMHSPDVNAIHPFGKVPVMRHGDFTLCESKAIASYIDASFPGVKLIPQDIRLGALVEQWVSLVNTIIDPCLIRAYFLGYQIPKATGRPLDRAQIDAVLPTMQSHIDILDRAVATTGFLVGNQFTLADINLLPVLHYIQCYPEGAAMMRAAKHLSAYFARHSERKSYKASFPPPVPTANTESR